MIKIGILTFLKRIFNISYRSSLLFLIHVKLNIIKKQYGRQCDGQLWQTCEDGGGLQ